MLCSTVTPIFDPGFPGFASFEDIVSDNCDNCESQGIQIKGHGQFVEPGIEVVKGGGIPNLDSDHLYQDPHIPIALPTRKPAKFNSKDAVLLPDISATTYPILSTSGIFCPWFIT